MAHRLLQEISHRWPGQAGRWGSDPEKAGAWGRGLLSIRADPGQLGAALTRLTSRPFPPDLGALLAEMERPRYSETQALEMLRRAARAAGVTPPAWHTLAPIEYAAAQVFGGYELRQAGVGDLPRWQAILASLDGLDLPVPPVQPKGHLGHRPDHRSGLECMRAWATARLKGYQSQ